MAKSHLKAISSLVHRAKTHLLESPKKGSFAARRVVTLAIFGALLLNMFPMFLATAPTAFAVGEQYKWNAKDVIQVNGGSTGQGGAPGGGWVILGTTGTIRDNTACDLRLTFTNFTPDHSRATVTASTANLGAGADPCNDAILRVYNGTFNIANSQVWGAADIPIGCPGGPAGPTNGTYPCPGGGQVINGTYYPDGNTGIISGKVLLEANCNQATCACGNATVNVNRVNGTASGDTTVKTGGDGTYVLRLGAGVVTLSTPDCRKSTDNSIYSGTSGQITVEANKNKGGNNYVAGTLVSQAGQGDDVCDNANFTELNFWVCGFIKLLADTARGLDDAVLGLLKINTDNIFNDSGNAKSGNAYFLAWAAFRNIAYAILVLFALIMILSQILGMDFVDAYTFRKMLPRLLLAVLFIAISWNGLDFLFNLSNDAADAIRSIIAAPFSGINVTVGNTTSNTISLAILIPLLLTIGVPTGVAALALLGVGGIAALVGTVVLAAFSAWVLLVARDVIAALLVIMSPVAIIMWAFGK
jgi:hypothetical protein